MSSFARGHSYADRSVSPPAASGAAGRPADAHRLRGQLAGRRRGRRRRDHVARSPRSRQHQRGLFRRPGRQRDRDRPDHLRAELFTDGTNPVPGTITLSGVLLRDAAGVDIEGPGAHLLTIDGHGFPVSSGAVAALSALTISHGRGIYNTGTLTVTDVTVSGNSVSGDGGGIYNTGTLTVTDSTVSGNNVTAITLGGGGIYSTGTLTVTDSTVSGNYATGSGGGIYSTGTLTVTGSTVSGNSATSSGGGIYSTGTLTVTRTRPSRTIPPRLRRRDLQQRRTLTHHGLDRSRAIAASELRRRDLQRFPYAARHRLDLLGQLGQGARRRDLHHARIEPHGQQLDVFRQLGQPRRRWDLQFHSSKTHGHQFDLLGQLGRHWAAGSTGCDAHVHQFDLLGQLGLQPRRRDLRGYGTFTNSTFLGNSASAGGGIWSGYSSTLTNSIVASQRRDSRSGHQCLPRLWVVLRKRLQSHRRLGRR